MHCFAQSHYAECFLEGDGNQKLLANSREEIFLVTDSSISKFDKSGQLVWRNASNEYKETLYMPEDGSIFSRSYGTFTKYFAEDGHSWVYNTSLVFKDLTVTSDGSLYILEADYSTWEQEVLWLKKLSSNGEVQSEHEVTSKSQRFSFPKLTSDELGNIFIAYVTATETPDPERWQKSLRVAAFDSEGNNLWDVLQGSELATSYREVYVSVSVAPTRDIIALVGYSVEEDPYYRSYLHKVNASDGASLAVQKHEFQTHYHGGFPTRDFPRVYYVDNSIYLEGIVTFPRLPDDTYVPDRSQIIRKKLSDLSNESVLDFGEYAESGEIQSIYFKGGDIIISSRSADRYKIHIDRYREGAKTHIYDTEVSYMKAYPGYMVQDQFGHYWMTDEDCIVKIIPCSEFSLDIPGQPASTEICPQTDASFTVQASGKNLTYYWYKGDVLLDVGPKYEGTRSSVLKIKQAGADDQGNYRCEVRDGCNRSKFSEMATLTVTAPPELTLQPLNAVACEGETVSFLIGVDGGKNLSFRWKKGNAVLADDSHIVGSKTNNLQILQVAPEDVAVYTCEIIADCSVPVVSQAAMLSVQPTTIITNHPIASLVRCESDFATLSVQAMGTNLSYAWKRNGQTISDGNGIEGSATSTLSFTSLESRHEGQYSCVVFGDCGPAIASTTSIVRVNSRAAIGSQPESRSICVGGTATFSVMASGSDLSFQWRKQDVPLANSAKYAGVNSPTLTISGATASEEGFYTCRVTGPCNEIISTIGVLEIGEAATLMNQSSDLAVCEGATASLSITTSGDVQTYRWKKDGVTLSENSGTVGTSTANLYIGRINALDAGSYVCEFQSGCGPLASSAPIKLTVSARPVVVKQPVSQTLCEETTLTLAVESANSGSFQWMFNGTPLVNGGDVTGVSGATLIITNVTTAHEGQYKCHVVGCGGEVSSDNASIVINPKPQLRMVLNCENYSESPGWSSLVTDDRNTLGQYFIYREGETEPLPSLNYITEAGLYTIVKETNFCSDEIIWDNQCAYTITATEDFDDWGISLSPNPSPRWINIKYNASKVSVIAIYDAKGGLLINENASSSGEMSIDGIDWAGGIYLIKLSGTDVKSSVKRLALQK